MDYEYFPSSKMMMFVENNDADDDDDDDDDDDGDGDDDGDDDDDDEDDGGDDDDDTQTCTRMCTFTPKRTANNSPSPNVHMCTMCGAGLDMLLLYTHAIRAPFSDSQDTAHFQLPVGEIWLD
eukprot:1072954-Amphidinium_carterae.1